MGFHIDEDQLDQYAMGSLPEESLAGVEEHLLWCASCQGRLASSQEFLELFRVAAVEPGLQPSRSFWRERVGLPRLVWAGAFMLAGLGVLFVMQVGQKPNVTPATVLMQSLRGPEAGGRTRAGSPALLVFDAPENSAAASGYRAVVVDVRGKEIFATAAEWKDGKLTAQVHALRRGSYWVRLYGAPANEPIAEYRLTVE